MKPTEHGKLKIETNGNSKFLTPEDICYCQAEGSYTRVYLTTGKSHLYSKNIKCVEAMLPENLFFRCHHSCLVNLNEIETIDFEGTKVLQKLYQIPISKRKLAGLFYKWNSYKENDKNF